MIFLTLDIESYYDKQYSIEKMPGSLYVQDERFEALSVVVKRRGYAPIFAGGPKRVAELFAKLRKHQDRIIMCGHNLHFDGYVASHHYNFIPAFYVCTMSLARPLYGKFGPLSLEHLSKELGAPQAKTTMPDIVGKRWHELTVDERRALALYNRHDVEATEYLASIILPQIPRFEQRIADMTIRMFTQGLLRINVDEARQIFDDERREKIEAAAAVGIEPEIIKGVTKFPTLSSNEQFAELLEERGYECPLKWSEAKQEYSPALAQSDLPFQAMRDSDDKQLSSLINARLRVKSTINETRAKAMLARSPHPVPIALNYCGAINTMRWSGADKFNPQNLPRDGRLRRCLEAPDGYTLVVADAAQIEARDNGSFSEQWDLLDEFREYDRLGKGNAPSPYRKMASAIYRKPLDEITDDERFVGKTTVLGCGYQMGAPKLQLTLEQGMMGPPMIITLEESQQAINAYRVKNYAIKQTWSELQARIPFMMPNSQREEEFRGLVFMPGKVRMPNGMYLYYPDIDYRIGKFDSPDYYFHAYDPRYKKVLPSKLYGGLLLENIIQCRSRIMTAGHALELSKYYRVVLTVHDEIVMCVPNKQAETCLRNTLEIMSIPPRWNENCPLKGEGKISKHYLKP